MAAPSSPSPLLQVVWGVAILGAVVGAALSTRDYADTKVEEARGHINRDMDRIYSTLEKIDGKVDRITARILRRVASPP